MVRPVRAAADLVVMACLLLLAVPRVFLAAVLHVCYHCVSCPFFLMLFLVTMQVSSPVSAHGDTITITGNSLMGYCTNGMTVNGQSCASMVISGKEVRCRIKKLNVGPGTIDLLFGNQTYELSVVYHMN